jgi:hypothetical protein
MITTPSSCLGKYFKDFIVDDHATASTLAFPSVSFNHKCPFFILDVETVAFNINFGANPLDSNNPIDSFNSLTLYVVRDCLAVLRSVKLLKIKN